MIEFGDPRLPQRFWSKVRVADSGCWEWTAYRKKDGYGNFYWEARQHLAHRVAYLVLVGPIPTELQMDHLCRNKPCVNPAHLEAVSCFTNLFRSPDSHVYRYVTATHCKNGHEWTRENTAYSRYSGNKIQRVCKQCKGEARRRWREAHRAQEYAQNRQWLLKHPHYTRDYWRKQHPDFDRYHPNAQKD